MSRRLLCEALPDLNWAGFYRNVGGELVLGPFQGKAACIRIPFGKGVCGTAAATREAQCVADVHAFPGHIACDAASRSELVIPLLANGELVGVLDLDSPMPGPLRSGRRRPAVPNWHSGSKGASAAFQRGPAKRKQPVRIRIRTGFLP